ncbi:MAG TPA: AraC family transcriptional regulator [Armatimonadota bacterium]|nr:AraC family transcriptional regulator [Armatimonadota bacterium]
MNIYCGLKQQPPGYHFATGRYDHFQVICLQEGELRMTVQNVVTALRAGEACVLPAGSAFRLRCVERGYRGVGVILSGATEPRYRGAARALAGTPALRALAGVIEDEARRPGDPPDGVLRHLGLALAELGLRPARADADARPAAWVRAACQSIERAIYANQSLADSLAGIPRSYRQLSRLFLAALGMTPKQYHVRCRLAEAERLLTGTTFTITAIAYELGFASSQHFSSQFARRNGMSPSAYRALTGGR